MKKLTVMNKINYNTHATECGMSKMVAQGDNLD